MQNPIKVDLYLDEKNSCNLHSTYVGGNNDTIKLIEKINNKKYKYLKGIYTNKQSQINNICFEFDNNINKQDDIFGSTYLGKGGLTSVFGLKYLTNNFMTVLTNKKLVLRAL